MNYLYGEMNRQEKTIFEEELDADQQLSDELLLHQEIDKAIQKEVQIKSFRNLLDDIHESSYGKRKNNIINLQNKWYWAAASITAFSGTAIYTLSRQMASPDHLYQKYYEVWQPAFITRGISSEKDMDKVVSAFEAHNFNQTLALINNLDLTTKTSPKIRLIHGCTLMEMNQFEDAINIFKQFESEDYTLYTETAEWYKGLCYLKNDNTEQAIKTFKLISDNDNVYAEEANELLKKLK